MTPKTRKTCSSPGCSNTHNAKGLCKSHYNKKYSVENRDKIIAQKNIYHSKPEVKSRRQAHERTYRMTWRRTPEFRFRRGKRDAERRGFQWNLSFEEYSDIVKHPCTYCLGPLSETGYSLDRIDNSKREYSSDNVLQCCFKCNALRRDELTVEETQLLVVTLYEARGTELGKLWQK